MPRHNGVSRVVDRCGVVCEVIRHLPFRPPRPGHRHKLIKHWPFVLGGMALFSVGVFIVGHGFVAGLVAARIVEATGDLLLDRGIVDNV